uniref:Uncharacterized protein n=1 Tax=Anopheles quadriannulatus TaxID=34691 RepID=A0A182XTC5_ANOQN
GNANGARLGELAAVPSAQSSSFIEERLCLLRRVGVTLVDPKFSQKTLRRVAAKKENVRK